MFILPLVSLGSYSEGVLGLGLLVEVFIPINEWDVNRFWDPTTWIGVISEQITNQVGPKQAFELL
jgi:hypothetical protein